jgi:hypothetical protein
LGSGTENRPEQINLFPLRVFGLPDPETLGEVAGFSFPFLGMLAVRPEISGLPSPKYLVDVLAELGL